MPTRDLSGLPPNQHVPNPMPYRLLPCLLLTLAFTPVARAQSQAASAEECAVQPLDLSATTLSLSSGAAEPAARTEAEARVQAIVSGEGIHVVHFWAPWCSNSLAELERGWSAFVERNPDVTFTFVTVWNDGESGRATLNEYALPGTVVEITQPDFGPSDDLGQRRRQFLGLPLTWIPSTWIFRNGGELAFALNYAEMEMSTLQHLVDVTKEPW